MTSLTFEEAGKMWSDCPLAARNPITALQIKKDEVSGSPHSLRARWGFLHFQKIQLPQVRDKMGSVERDWPKWLPERVGMVGGQPCSRGGRWHSRFGFQCLLKVKLSNGSKWRVEQAPPLPLLPASRPLPPLRGRDLWSKDPSLPLDPQRGLCQWSLHKQFSLPEDNFQKVYL